MDLGLRTILQNFVWPRRREAMQHDDQIARITSSYSPDDFSGPSAHPSPRAPPMLAVGRIENRGRRGRGGGMARGEPRRPTNDE